MAREFFTRVLRGFRNFQVHFYFFSNRTMFFFLIINRKNIKFQVKRY